MIAAQPTVDLLEQRLLAWAAWRTAGMCGAGYPTRNVLDPSWSPPSPGMRPGMRVVVVGDAQERAIDGHIRDLSVKLRDALYVVYIKRLQPDDQARALGCQTGTVRARVAEAKRQLGVLLRGGFTS